MCRSIKTLRPPYAERVTDEDIHAAAWLQDKRIGIIFVSGPLETPDLSKA